MNKERTIRPPSVAGMFYPSDPNMLRRQIAELLLRVGKKKVAGKIRGIVSPHAGYMYSGFTAAHGYSMLQGETFETVVIVSPSHREYFHGVSVYSGDAYRTPLGDIEVDTKLREELIAASDFIVASEQGHHAEHALEVQLPFLQEVLPPFTLLPIVIGDQDAEFCLNLGKALTTVLAGKNVLFVASTDLSHFYSSDTAEKLDNVMIRDVQKFDYMKLMHDLELQSTEACGGGPTVAVLYALRGLGVKSIEVIHHSNSGDVTGNYKSVVGYLSAIAYS